MPRRAGRRQEFAARPAAPSAAPAPLAAPPMSPPPSCRPGAGHDTRACTQNTQKCTGPLSHGVSSRGCVCPHLEKTSHRAVPQAERAHEPMATLGSVFPQELEARALSTTAHHCRRAQPASQHPPPWAAAWRCPSCPGAAVPCHAVLCHATPGHGKDPHGSAHLRKPRATQQSPGGWLHGTG